MTVRGHLEGRNRLRGGEMTTRGDAEDKTQTDRCREAGRGLRGVGGMGRREG